MDFQSGQQLLHYRVVEKIGEGGMGVVYAAEDTKLNRRVALKVLPKPLADDPDRRARFEREAQSVAALNHPNIVTLYSVEEADGVHFITMELVEGGSLSAKIPPDGFDLHRLLEIAIPLADAVASAHRSGITHRDLKPDNIMIDDEGRLRVLDFGLAKLQDASATELDTQGLTATAVTGEGKILGTVAYMSPEQAEGKPVDPRSDVFSLGTMLYEMASGRRPFHGDSSMSILSSILKEDPRPLIDLNPLQPRHLDRIVRRCLAKEPDRRYQSALDLRNELEELKNEVASGVHTADPQEKPAETKSNVGRWAMLGVIVVLTAIFTFVYFRGFQREAAPRQFISRPITSTLGYEDDLNWSPEGEFLTYGMVREGSFDVMVKPVTGGDAVVRAGGPGDQTAPRWSPDGKYLAYISSYEPGTYIYLVPPHSGEPKKLIETNISTLGYEGMSSSMGDRPWSLDSRTLLVSRVIYGEDFDDMGRGGSQAIYRVDRDNGSAEQLSFPPRGSVDLSPSYSFDGKRIVFQRRSYGRGAILVMPAVGGDPEVLLSDEFDNVGPIFRPDGRHILFRSVRGGPVANLWELDLDTGSRTQLTFETRRFSVFTITATNRIAYVPFWHDTFLFEVDVATGERRQLTSHTKENYGGRYSPDGTSIAYHSTRTGNCEIFLHYLDGRSEMQITDDPGWDFYPDWSPDGKQMIFTSNRQGGEFRLFIANSDGSGPRQLVDQAISVDDPKSPVNAKLVCRWSPDGKKIGYLVSSVESTSLWTVNPDGKNAQEVIRHAKVGWFDWYRDSRRAIYTRRQGSSSEMIAINLESGEEQTLFTGPLLEMDVAHDGSAVSFCTGPGHMGMGIAVLKLEPSAEPDGLPRAVGEPEFVVQTEGTWHTHNGGWSFDSKSIVYTQDRDYGDIYELVEKQ